MHSGDDAHGWDNSGHGRDGGLLPGRDGSGQRDRTRRRDSGRAAQRWSSHRYGRRPGGWRALVPGLVLALALGGCTGIGVGEAPSDGSAEYQVWGLSETSSTLTGDDRTVVLNGDLNNDAKPFFTASGEWRKDGFLLDEKSAAAARELAVALPERTGDPDCTRMVLVDDGLISDQAVAVLAADQVTADGPVVASPLEQG